MSNPKLMAFCNLINERKKHLSSYRFFLLCSNLGSSYVLTIFLFFSQAQGMLLYHIASKIRPQIKQHIEFLAKYVTDGKLDSEVRVNAALEYLISNASSKAIDMAELDQACGVGVVVTPEQIENAVEKVLNANKDEILEKRYR